MVPNQKVVISVELITNTNIQSVTIHSEDGTAKAGTDYEFIQKHLGKEEIAAGQFSLKLNSLFKEVLLEDKEFTLVFTVAYKEGGTKTLTKTIQIRSFYQKMKYVKMFYGTYVTCGLSNANELFCWGNLGSSSANTFGSESQPVKIIPAENKRIDLEKFKVSNSNFCFQQINSKKVYCKQNLISDKSARTLKVDETKFVLSEDDSYSWELSSRDFLLVLSKLQDGRRRISFLQSSSGAVVSSTSSTGPVYEKILGAGNGLTMYASDNADNIYHINFQSSAATALPTRLNIKGSDIAEISSNSVAILKDGRVGQLSIFGYGASAPTSDTDFEAKNSPEPLIKWVGSNCMQSASGKIYCPKANSNGAYEPEVVYDLSVLKFKSIGGVERLSTSYPIVKACGLNENFEYHCRGFVYSTYTDGFNFVNSFTDPTPKSKESIDSNYVSGRISYNVLTLKPDPAGPAICDINSDGIVSCNEGKRIPFGKFKMRPETIKGLSDNPDFFYTDTDLVIGQTIDGQWLISGFAIRQFPNWNIVYQRKPEFQNLVLGEE